MTDKERCKQMVLTGQRWFRANVQCKHAAKRDGYCGTHHPDAVEAKKAKAEIRQKETTERWKAKWSAEDQKAKDAAEAPALRVRVAELEAEVAGLRDQSTKT